MRRFIRIPTHRGAKFRSCDRTRQPGRPNGIGDLYRLAGITGRVSPLRRVRGMNAYRSAEKNGEWLTMSEAAVKLGVSNHQIRRLIKQGILAADQVVPDAPYQIRANDLLDERVTTAITRKGRPCRPNSEKQTSMFSGT